jgi:hypothetical protein
MYCHILHTYICIYINSKLLLLFIDKAYNIITILYGSSLLFIIKNTLAT